MGSPQPWYLTPEPTGRIMDRLSTEEKIKFLLEALAYELGPGNRRRDAAKWMAERFGFVVHEKNLSTEDFDSLINQFNPHSKAV